MSDAPKNAIESPTLTPDDVETLAEIRKMLASGTEPRKRWLRALDKLLPAEHQTPSIPDGDPSGDGEILIQSPQAKQFFVSRFRDISACWAALQAEVRAGRQRVQDVLNIVDADQKGESVRLAANDVERRLAHKLEHLEICSQRSEYVISMLESVSCMKDTIGIRATERLSFTELFIDDLKRFDEMSGHEASEVQDLSATIDAVEFAAASGSVDQLDLDRVVGAMANILTGVTALRGLGLEDNEIAWSIEEYVSLRWRYGEVLQLLGPTISPTQAPGTQANNKTKAKQREQLIGGDEWIRRFLSDFWCMQWRNRYEQGRPTEEHDKNIERALQVIPTAIDEEPTPVDERSVCNEVRSRLRSRTERDKTEPLKIRIRDEHVIKALKQLIESGASGPMGIIEVKGDTPKTPKYWTRRRDADARASSLAAKAASSEQ